MISRSLPDLPESIEDQSDRPWPPRPAAVELAGAILIVGGALGILLTILSASSLPPGTEPFVGLTAALGVGSIAVGLLVRFGRLWIIAVNYAAVLGFIDLLGAGASPLALMLGLADIAVVVILFVHRPWFDALRLRRSE
jgi:hypothetical protein